MCTAATYKTKDFYFGRTLDYEISYGDQVVITPRNYVFDLREGGQLKNHYAMIGMACVMENYPLYYDAVNEKGLGIAGLNFVGNASYKKPVEGKDNITQFELIPWILGKCATVKEARQLLKNMNLIDTPFLPDLPVAQLHWIIADKEESFNYQMFNLNNYMQLAVENRSNTFSENLKLNQYSRGMGGMGLPGDLSSQSRFVRVAFVKMNSLSGDSEEESVSQFFHILGSVDQQRGCCKLGEDKYEITLYTSCCNTDKGIYYYNTYDNH
ncbi:MAG: choloylglycine hydrolase, partial [Clostridiales bacterium 44_9]